MYGNRPPPQGSQGPRPAFQRAPVGTPGYGLPGVMSRAVAGRRAPSPQSAVGQMPPPEPTGNGTVTGGIPQFNIPTSAYRDQLIAQLSGAPMPEPAGGPTGVLEGFGDMFRRAGATGDMTIRRPSFGGGRGGMPPMGGKGGGGGPMPGFHNFERRGGL